MDIDCDWCLTCEKHIETNSPYCSLECQERALPQSYWHHPAPAPAPADELEPDVIYHSIDEPSESRWTGNDYAGIEAWAAQIPYGAPAADDTPSSSSSSSSAFHQQPQGAPHQASPPVLLTSSCLRRTLPPSLSMATPPHVRPPPSNPMQTPRRQPSFSSIAPTANASMGQTSLHSAATGSSLVGTPYSSQPVPILRKPSMFDGMYSHVRSWVSPAPIHHQLQQSTQAQKPHRTHPSQLISHAPSHHAAAPVFPVRVVSSPQSSCGLSEKSAVCWIPNPAVVKQPQLDTKPIKVQRGRKLLGADLAEHPSFRTRGRKASRAAA